MTDSELRRRANERLDAWLRDYDKHAARGRLEDVVSDLAGAIENYRYCPVCGQERALHCPGCGTSDPHEADLVYKSLDAVREEIDRQVELFYMAS